MNDAKRPDSDQLPMAGSAPPPVFNCVVYVAKAEKGYTARNGHWTELTCNAPSERDTLRQLVTAFKQKVAEEYGKGATLPFDDDPAPKRDDETIRLVPVHL